MRRDTLAGREAVTVYYARAGQQVAYTIVRGTDIAAPTHGSWAVGVQSLDVGGRTVVTWLRDGDTCVISARGVPASVLVRLANAELA